MYDRYLIYRAYHCFKRNIPIPVTLFSELVQVGIDPEDIESAFHEGYEPPFEITDPSPDEEDDEDDE